MESKDENGINYYFRALNILWYVWGFLSIKVVKKKHLFYDTVPRESITYNLEAAHLTHAASTFNFCFESVIRHSLSHSPA